MRWRLIIALSTVVFLASSFTYWKANYWDLFKEMEVKTKFFPPSLSYENKIKFSKAVQRLEGKKIRLKGYFIEGWGASERYELTFFRYQYPNLRQPQMYVTEMVALDDSIKFKITYHKEYLLEGTLRLNAIDRFKLPYRLEDIKCINCKEKKVTNS